MAKLSRVNAECEGRLQRMQDDMMGMSRRVEQVILEKQRVKETLEALAQEQNMEVEQMRKRKEKYKALLAEEQATCAALRLAASDRVMDRTQLIATIRAQEQLLQERTKQSEHLRREATDAFDKASRAETSEAAKRDDIRILSESLKEYQSAANKWMSEHSAMDKELSQLRMQVDSTRIRYDFPTSPNTNHSPLMDKGKVYNFPQHNTAVPNSPYSAAAATAGAAITHPGVPGRSTPRRNQSPSAAAVRSPFFRQPAISSPLSPSTVASTSRRANSPTTRWSSK